MNLEYGTELLIWTAGALILTAVLKINSWWQEKKEDSLNRRREVSFWSTQKQPLSDESDLGNQ